ncbi:hypothetical protein AURDEDRAFT_149208 [Auricularia subglabra TFB-10046 SS5]|nr:hypothetical protein AURDEDRAFT_149208 [Auricularia subglabra TFB-10046 SS5]
MPALNLMLLVAPEFARLAVLPVLAVLLAARCLAPPAAPCSLPYWRAVSAGVLLVVPLVMLTASLGLVAWGFVSRHDEDTALNFFGARDIVLQVSWLPFDLGVLYFFNPAVVLVLLPPTRLPRGVLIGLFIAVVVTVETARVLCLVGLVAPRLRSPAQTTTSVVSGLLLCLSVPLAIISRRESQPYRANPWIAISFALGFYTLSVALGIPSVTGNIETHYALLVGAACMQACALGALLVVFHSPATPHPPLQPSFRLSGYATPERQRGRPHRRSAASMQTFMSLRDPFASPPPTILREKKAHYGLSPLVSPPKARSKTRRGSVDSLGLDAAFLEKLVELSFSECGHSEDGSSWHGREFGVLAKGPTVPPSPSSTLVRERTDSTSTRRTTTPTPMPRAYRACTALGSPPSTPPSLVLSSPASSSRDWTRGLDSSPESDAEPL